MAGQGSSKLISMVQRFDGTNYEDWKSDVEALLRIEGLWEHVVGQVEIPTREDKDGYARYVQKENKAYGMICLLLDKTQKAHVTGTKTARAAWKALKDQFAKKGAQEAMFLRKRFLTLKMAEGTEILAHVTKMKEMVHEMSLLGVRTEDIDFILVLLGSLPSSWDTVVTAMEMYSEKLTVNFVLEKLRFEGAKRAYKESEEEDGIGRNEGLAFMAKKNEKGKAVRRCYHCGDPDHIRRNCPKLQEKEEQVAAMALGATSIAF